MVKATSPVDGYVALLAVETSSTLHGATSADAAKLKQPVKNRAIVTDVVSALFTGIVLHVVRSDATEEVDVFVRVKLGHLVDDGRLCALLFGNGSAIKF